MCTDLPWQVLFYTCCHTTMINSTTPPFPFKSIQVWMTNFKDTIGLSKILRSSQLEKRKLSSEIQVICQRSGAQLLNWVAKPWHQDDLHPKSYWLFWCFCLISPEWSVVPLNNNRQAMARPWKDSSFSVSRNKKSLELDSPRCKSEFHCLLFHDLGTMPPVFLCLWNRDNKLNTRLS